MPPQDNVVSQTIPHRGTTGRGAPRMGVLAVVGDGASLDSLRAARLVPIADLSIDIGRRPNAPAGRAWLALGGRPVVVPFRGRPPAQAAAPGPPERREPAGR